MIPPRDGWHRFETDEEKLDFLRNKKLIPKTLGLRPFVYSGGCTDKPVLCEIIGYDGDSFLVIELPDKSLHTIHRDYLSEMQATKTKEGFKIKFVRDAKKSPESFVVFDFETTDRNHKIAEVVEIGAVKYIDRKQSETFHSLVSYTNQMSIFAADVHHISDSDLDDAPPIKDVLPKFMEFVGELPLIAHNGFTFDFLVLERICEAQGIPCVLDGYDSLQVAKKSLRCPNGHSLKALKEYYEITGNDHRALDDALASAEVWKLCFPSQFSRSDDGAQESERTKRSDAKWIETLTLLEKLKATISSIDQNYDTSVIRAEHRTQKSSESEAITILGYPICTIKGVRNRSAYFTSTFRKPITEATNDYKVLSGGVLKISISYLIQLFNDVDFAIALYEICLAGSDPFGCCSAYIECSDAKKCVRTDPMLYGRCQYRRNLIEGRIFYGKNAVTKNAFWEDAP